MLQIKKKCLFLFLVLLGLVTNSNANEIEREQLIGILNDTNSGTKEKIVAFSDLIKIDTSSLEAEAFLAKIFIKPDTLSNLLKNRLLFIYSFTQNNFEPVLAYSQNILADQNCSTTDSTQVYKSLSNYYKNRGYYNTASEYIVKIININNRNKDFIGTEKAYASLARIMMNQEMYNLAVLYYKKSISPATEKARPLHTWRTMNNIGVAFKNAGILDSALHYYNNILILIDSHTDTKASDKKGALYLKALVNGNIGDIYILQGKYKEAVPLLEFDLKTSLEYKDYRNVCINKLHLAKATLELGNFNEAKSYLEQGKADIEKYSFTLFLSKYLLYSAEYHQKIGNYTKSSTYYADYISLSDSIAKETSNNSIVDKTMNIVIEQKDEALQKAKNKNQEDSLLLEAKRNQLYFTFTSILILVVAILFIYRSYRQKSALNAEMVAKNNEIKRKGLELERTIGEKELMLKEVHHRVKNNLQLVSSLLRLQSNEIDEPKVYKAIEESINRLNSISLIHQKLYMKDNFHTIRFKSYYENLTEQVSALYNIDGKKIDYKTDVKDIDLSIDNAIPLGLIINEIISNSFKHAFAGRDEGVISISIDKVDQTVKMTLRDDGIGFQSKPEEDKSFGETLIYLLVEQIDGQINCYDDNGTVYDISFKD